MVVPVLHSRHCPGQSQERRTTWLSEARGSGEELEHTLTKRKRIHIKLILV